MLASWLWSEPITERLALATPDSHHSKWANPKGKNGETFKLIHFDRSHYFVLAYIVHETHGFMNKPL
jgi:hypothetical protein